ncbi:NAD-dependent epimerase/dehydratase family protein [Mycobacterium sp. HNNTM2301]|uniref:NAD-dependent epimerase/dehydratase family protein n=1 Tax=Mycobacterium hainanense TaxID=3289775 RepID=UPI0035A69939
MPDRVLVTGALGLVGRYTVNELSSRGADVVATDLDTKRNRKAARQFAADVDVRFADLTDAAAVGRLVAAVQPSVVVHLAAVIPPVCYRNVRVARAVNVGATATLVDAARQLPNRPRFVQASSVAVYGARNPHRGDDLLTDSTPLRASDCYGQHKIEAEAVVRSSSLPWVILRLGAIISTDLRAMTVGADQLFMEWSFPVDGRITTVDVRDVAAAFASATTADVVGRTLLIAGDRSHRQLQGDVGPALVAALGLGGAYPRGRVGDPDDDDEWFVCDWMETEPAEEALAFQNHPWPHMLDEIRARVGLLRFPLRALVPVLRPMLARRSPYHGAPGHFAEPWRTIRSRWPESVPDNESV